MGHILEIKFFNTFILRSETTDTLYVEESRMKGGFNEDFVSIGPKAHLVNDTYAETRRENALIYSGIYNSRTDINRTNVFSGGEKITRAVDPSNGAIQKLHAEDTNLNILQEDKVSRALIDKDALFTAEGGRLTASGAAVIGQVVPFTGKYGIQNPESFAVHGNRKYFVDKDRGVVLRLSSGIGGGNGLIEISQFGMRDYFKDNLNLIDNSFDSSDKIVGGYDNHSDEYVVSLQNSNIESSNADQRLRGFQTLNFDDSTNGWVSFYTFKPDFIFSIDNKFYSLKNNNLWEHYKNTEYNKFYDNVIIDSQLIGGAFTSNITFIANTEPSTIKNFYTINYEGDDSWKMISSKTDTNIEAFPVLENTNYSGSDVLGASFVEKENKYYANLKDNTTGTLKNQVIGVNPAGIKGFFTTVEMQNGANTKKELFAVSHIVSKSS